MDNKILFGVNFTMCIVNLGIFIGVMAATGEPLWLNFGVGLICGAATVFLANE